MSPRDVAEHAEQEQREVDRSGPPYCGGQGVDRPADRQQAPGTDESVEPPGQQREGGLAGVVGHELGPRSLEQRGRVAPAAAAEIENAAPASPYQAPDGPQRGGVRRRIARLIEASLEVGLVVAPRDRVAP